MYKWVNYNILGVRISCLLIVTNCTCFITCTVNRGAALNSVGGKRGPWIFLQRVSKFQFWQRSCLPDKVVHLYECKTKKNLSSQSPIISKHFNTRILYKYIYLRQWKQSDLLIHAILRIDEWKKNLVSDSDG